MNELRPTCVVICEDSRSYARALTRFLEHEGDLRVVAVCSTSDQLLSALGEVRCDLITMNAELPGLDDASAIGQIIRSHATPIVVISGQTERGSTRAVATMAAGALDAIHKRDLQLDVVDSASARAVRHRLARLARASMGVGRTTFPTPSSPNGAHGPDGSGAGRSALAVGIGSSTGGPAALVDLLSRLPADFPLPVLVVQHISAGFTEGLVRWLDDTVALPVQLARDGQRATRGAWFAPTGAHLVLESNLTMRLDHETDLGPHRPSVDVLLTSLARTIGHDAVGVVLTGMGRDGAEGAAAIHAAGGLVVVQDKDSSVIDGMPSAARHAAAALSLPPRAIGALLSTLRVARSSS